MKARVARVLAAVLLASTPAWTEKLSEDFRTEFQRQIHKKTYAVVVQKGIPTVPINGMDNEQYGSATFGVDIVSPHEWKSSAGLLDTNQQIAEFLDVGELVEVVDVTFKDNRVDLRTVSTEAKKIERGAWILKTESRETVSTNFKFFFPAEWKPRFLTREDVPAAIEYVSHWLRPFPEEASARRFSAQIVGGNAPATDSASAPAPPPVNASTTSAAAPAAPAPTVTKEIKIGMTALEVVDVMGRPQKQLTFGNNEKWIYPDLTVLLENGKVKDVEF